jgi:hypothetical protein
MQKCVCVWKREKCLSMCVYVCMIDKNVSVAECRLCLCLCLCLYYFMCTGPDHASLSRWSAVCHTVRMHTASVCARMCVCV